MIACEASVLDKLIVFILWFLWLLFERWLGRTSKVQANSTIDLVATISVALISAIISQRGKHD